ncbi:unnamed protein product, partial [Hapterophycus canaliculatus]
KSRVTPRAGLIRCSTLVQMQSYPHGAVFNYWLPALILEEGGALLVALVRGLRAPITLGTLSASLAPRTTIGLRWALILRRCARHILTSQRRGWICILGLACNRIREKVVEIHGNVKFQYGSYLFQCFIF